MFHSDPGAGPGIFNIYIANGVTGLNPVLTPAPAPFHGPATSGAKTPAPFYGPVKSGAKTPAPFHGPVASGVKTPAPFYGPGPGGAMDPEKYFDPGPGGFGPRPREDLASKA